MTSVYRRRAKHNQMFGWCTLHLIGNTPAHDSRIQDKVLADLLALPSIRVCVDIILP